jgi:Right handed beta helix region
LCRAALGSATVAAAIVWPAVASGHAERPGYWPDPAPDTSVVPPAGGAVPKARTLASALKRKPPGRTRVVCQRGSLRRARVSIRRARANGYEIRPSDRRRLTAKQARRLRRINRKLRKRCRFSAIQAAVTASRNNDRVVVMPGLYTEPASRAAPTNDPACEQYHTKGDRPGENEALSYEYQMNCPNDQNLIAVLGRGLGSGEEPDPPREDRHGIPNIGPCIRCNLQLEGSGVSADDVVIEAGDPAAGNGGPNGVGSAKDVGVRADRADGFVLRKVTVRHAGEHGLYVLESDGYLFDRFKAFYNRLYGTLSFVEDHGVQQNCEAVGHGDSGIYPGAALESGVQRPEGAPFRYNQEVRRCDLHHNLAGYSGTNGNAVHVHHNNVYDNALGIQTDVVTGAGHPGYPGDSALFERNQIHSNNYNPYTPESDVKASFPFPVGTGLWIAGGNHHVVRENDFYDNWRRGTMLFSVPDSLICGPATGNSQAGCEPNEVSTSHYNSHYDNRMGVRPGGSPDPNGTDFWWDSFTGSRGNCWFRNTGPKPITTSPPALPNCDNGTDPGTSVGTGYPPNESELTACLVAFETRTFQQGGPCPWFDTPPEPGPDGSGGGGSGNGSLLGLGFSGASGGRSAGGDAQVRSRVPLGQLSCRDWKSADAAARASMVERVRGFAGGVVVTGAEAVGTGAVLPDSDAHRLYEAWCGRDYAEAFLLYKLYTHAAAFARRD